MPNSSQPVLCDESKCPKDFRCTAVPQENKQVCCPADNKENLEIDVDKLEDQLQESTTDIDRVQTS